MLQRVGNYWDHVESPQNAGLLDGANGVGVAGKLRRPPFMTVYLRIEQGAIAAAKYRSSGCAPSIAAGSAITQVVIGRTTADLRSLDDSTILEMLEGMPPDKAWCAKLAIAAFRRALADYESRRGAEGK